jgi:NADH-quinone oxidoreductase subunit L
VTTIAADILGFTHTLGSVVLAAQGAPAASCPAMAAPGMFAFIPALPILGVVLCTLCAIFKVKSKLPAFITVLCLAGSFALTVGMYQHVLGLKGGAVVVKAFDWINFAWGADGGRTAGHAIVADFSFYLDSLTCLWMLFVSGLATLIALYGSEYMSHDVGPGYCRFFVAFNLFVFSMACLVMGDNLLMLYLGWEGVGLCSYLLIGYFYKRPSAVAAAKKAFIMNRIGDLGLALGIMLIFVKFGTLQYKDLFANAELRGYLELARSGEWSSIPFTVQLIPMLLMIGAFGKSAQLPLYVWLPDAMEGPTPVSALIHAATMVTAGVYLIARTYPLFQSSHYALPTVAWVGTLTAFLAATIGMAQFDIKRIMAYSTVSQLGYMFAGLGVLTSAGAAFHVFTHAFFKALLFLSCGAVMHGFAGQLDLRKLSGVMWMKGWKVVGLGMLVGCLNLSGFPFTAGFFSKDIILAEAFSTPGMAPIGWILLLTAGLTAYYTFRVFFRVFAGPVEYHPGDELSAHDDHAGDHGHDAHGHGGAPAHDAHAPAHGTEHGSHGEFHPHAPGWAINLVLALLAIGSLLAALTYTTNWAPRLVELSSAKLVLTGAAHEGAGEHAGEAAHHASFLGLGSPHEIMYYVSGVVGAIGILAAFWLHYAGRTTAATSKADALLPVFGPLARGAQHKWYVDEVYDFVIVKPLWVVAQVFRLIDQILVDGLVNFFGAAPRGIGRSLRPTQSGELHGYALAMAGGLAFLLLIILMVAT